MKALNKLAAAAAFGCMGVAVGYTAVTTASATIRVTDSTVVANLEETITKAWKLSDGRTVSIIYDAKKPAIYVSANSWEEVRNILETGKETKGLTHD